MSFQTGFKRHEGLNDQNFYFWMNYRFNSHDEVMSSWRILHPSPYLLLHLTFSLRWTSYSTFHWNDSVYKHWTEHKVHVRRSLADIFAKLLPSWDCTQYSKWIKLNWTPSHGTQTLNVFSRGPNSTECSPFALRKYNQTAVNQVGGRWEKRCGIKSDCLCRAKLPGCADWRILQDKWSAEGAIHKPHTQTLSKW